MLPDVQKGDVIKIISLEKTEGRTKPPAPFTEGTLLSAMENPARYMAGESKDLIKTIGEAGGLGTVATRADIIEKLQGSFLIEKKGKHIHITSKGRQLLELVPEELKSPALTAQWEQRLGAISKGLVKKEDFINEMRDYTKTIVREIKNSQAEFRHDNITRTKCPECGKYMLEVNGKKGRMLVCQDRECGHRIGIARKTNARCPNAIKGWNCVARRRTILPAAAATGKSCPPLNREKQRKRQGFKKEVQRFMREQKKERKSR